MDLVFESTDEFNQDLAKFTQEEQLIILKELEHWLPLLLTNSSLRSRRLHQFCQFHLKDNYRSSLYSFIVNYYLRVILTIDEDPLFNRLSITLFKAIESRHAATAYRQVGNSIYEKIIDHKDSY
ncbi:MULTISPECIES: hypothetical protein [Arthrospira]|jgi:hypothetical protein|uniref:Uncharacterized protein n=1 Tax=Limnospira platensis NIES-46 TaxID=1236695 RepID=A0A5M3T0R2_LIMPL|nr:hypothetical protein [Arthrospira platensis]AMW29632.1 hypothetical protein AP285_18560 [Arthrospira platensis YZ]KDR57118.1 hypothetical protein APPUASWS_012855 [Arthrospira platensis str. Paraca]MBD2708744.1 hypothetical protein [Arthrospira platensis FACHB-835]MDF2212402.1 hypothetical protein [Arthrospira platensis NCB002]MDT9181605.1 hypothetical protein [Limnospira sp. PMC 289.06]MDT9293864.1 hypothetical protein [Arthrospira platensis PCC 7345]MDT9309230.1 hypothetical protein [Lim